MSITSINSICMVLDLWLAFLAAYIIYLLSFALPFAGNFYNDLKNLYIHTISKKNRIAENFKFQSYIIFIIRYTNSAIGLINFLLFSISRSFYASLIAFNSHFFGFLIWMIHMLLHSTYDKAFLAALYFFLLIKKHLN